MSSVRGFKKRLDGQIETWHAKMSPKYAEAGAALKLATRGRGGPSCGASF